MKIHAEIRKQVVDYLNGKVPGIKNFYDHQPNFIDAETETPAIAVFISDATADSATICANEWTGILNIAIYLTSHNRESDLDEIAEVISTKFDENDFIDNIDSCRISKYDYERDENHATWIASILKYELTY